MNKYVTYMRLHSASYIPGIGEIGPKIPGEKTIADLKLIASEAGVFLKAKGKDGRPVEAFMPWVNVQICVLGEEVPKESKSPKKD